MMDTEDGLKKQRDGILEEFHNLIETPMVVLGFIWLFLVILELVTSIPRPLVIFSTVIWIIFILEFLVEFTLASDKTSYLKKNWIVALSLFLPGFRVFRIVRFFRAFRIASALRGLRFLTIMTSVNRAMTSLRALMKRQGIGYVLALTLLIILTGSAGMYAFEHGLTSSFDSYWSSVWWTAMVMTTMGSQDWPQTLAGQILCLFLALYAFAIFGYVTGNLASFFIGRDVKHDRKRSTGDDSLNAWRAEIRALRKEIAGMLSRDQNPSATCEEDPSKGNDRF